MKAIKKTVLTALFLHLISGCSMHRVEIESYTFCDALEASSQYRVRVNGQEIFVLPTDEPHIAQFGCDGAVDVEVEYLPSAVVSAAVRPLGKDYAYRTEGNKIHFTLFPLDQVSVEVNGDLAAPLFVFANPLEKTDVQKARRDPATRFFGAGKIHHADTVTLANDQRIYIEGGAVLRGVLRAGSVKNITISGCGYLDARAPGHVRPIELFRSGNIALTNLTLLDSDCRSCVLAECDNMELRNFKSIVTAGGNQCAHESDAINLIGCRHATLRHCFAFAHHDAYCVEARKWDRGGPVSHIRFEECIGWNVTGGNTFEIGYQAGHDISDISYENIYSIHSGARSVLCRSAVSIRSEAHTTISGVTYRNVFIEDPTGYAIQIALLEPTCDVGDDEKWTGGGNIHNIRFDNVQILRPAPEGSEIYGVGDLHAVEDVVFRGLYLCGRHIRSLESGDFRKAIYCRDIVFE